LKSTGRALSYYDHNLLEIDWDAALLIDEPKNFDESLYVIELANFQLRIGQSGDCLDRSSFRKVGKPPSHSTP